MFDQNLGVKVVTTQSEEGYGTVIGNVFMNSKTEGIEIKNPIGIRSAKVETTETSELFKLEMYSMTKYSGGKSMILPSSKWFSISDIDPKIEDQYVQISENVESIKNDFDSIDMKKIMEDFTNGDSYDRGDTDPKIKERSEIRDRWFDKLI